MRRLLGRAALLDDVRQPGHGRRAVHVVQPRRGARAAAAAADEQRPLVGGILQRARAHRPPTRRPLAPLHHRRDAVRVAEARAVERAVRREHVGDLAEALVCGVLRAPQLAHRREHVQAGAVETQEDMLYRTALSLPSNVPPGAYVIRVLHFRNGVAISESKTDMKVMKAGLSALIYRFAHDYALFYGLFAIAFAVASGWLAAVAFRRG